MKTAVYISVLLLALAGCKKPYLPPATSTNNSYLVVEGVVNAGTDSTIIKLSHTVRVSDTVIANPVIGAVVAVLNDQKNSVQLNDAGNGRYISTGLNLDKTRQYQISIKAPDGKQYLSDLEPAMVTPPIDSIGYNIITVPDTGLQVYVNTHDPANSTHYYRWDYDEAWEFHTKYIAQYISNGIGFVQRQPDQFRTFCFSSDVSSDIVLQSSAKLQKDEINEGPISFLSFTSEKIEDEYSMLLREYALTPGAYTFWTNLKKNTEQLGSIFDALPSQVPGNIHCTTNPSEPVIGYFSVSTVSSKRLFIYNYNLPAWVPAYPFACAIDKTGTQGPGFLLPQPNDFQPMDGSGSTYTRSVCADCTARGGSLVKPSFFK